MSQTTAVDFVTTTFGKWILAGEHAVLRGHPALAFPLASRALKLEYREGLGPLEVTFAGERGADFKFLFHGVLEHGLKRLKRREAVTGSFSLTSDLPVGAGLGASAALCGAAARWFAYRGWVTGADVYEFACRLEDLFHGESSGVDVAVSLSGEGVQFIRGGERSTAQKAWQPRLYLSYCGQRGMTLDCVNKVKAGFDSHPKRAGELDLQMARAVAMCAEALRLDAAPGLARLAEGLKTARACFEQWGLCFGDLGEHMSLLEREGALAVKPTGSGGGGFALSLWDQAPPTKLNLISAF